MAFDFHFIYARANNDAYLKRFFEDLCSELRAIRGLPPEAQVGFFDQQSLEVSQDWEHSIVEAIGNSRVAVAVASPALFKSEYCGRELALFRSRFPHPAKGPFPPLIKPIVWVPFKAADVPPEFQVLQLTWGEPQAIHNTKGIRYLVKQVQQYATQYNDLIGQLALDIANSADAYSLPPLVNAPPLKDVASLWTQAAAVQSADPPPPPGIHEERAVNRQPLSHRTSEPSYDVFVSFKATDEQGQSIEDATLARSVHGFLTAKGFKVFNSSISLQQMGVSAYKRAIDAALDSARVLVAVGTSAQNLDAEWVRYEWDSFFSDILSGVKPDGRVFVYLKGVRTNDLPRALRQSQVVLHSADSLDVLSSFIANALGQKAP